MCLHVHQPLCCKQTPSSTKPANSPTHPHVFMPPTTVHHIVTYKTISTCSTIRANNKHAASTASKESIDNQSIHCLFFLFFHHESLQGCSRQWLVVPTHSTTRNTKKIAQTHAAYTLSTIRVPSALCIAPLQNTVPSLHCPPNTQEWRY
mmetsp:Transcript_25013/g.64577  ORF Transcript_25013/g.64577 Transcript_25013/m.64577 type:complete len:149 (-) Transcript_25013:1661-2107(-)